MRPHVLLFDVAPPELQPLVERLVERGAGCILNATPLRQALLERGLPIERWEAFEPPDLKTRVERELARIADGFARALQTPEGVAAFDSPRGNVVRAGGNQLFDQLLGMLARELVVIDTFRSLTQERDLGLVVLGCDNNHTERALVGAARAAAIPSLQIAHGLNVDLKLRIAGEMHTVYADEVAVFGERARRNLIASGNAPHRIVVTGAPVWDALYAPAARIEVAEARRRLDLDPARPVILFLPTCWDGNTNVFAHNAARFAETTRAFLRAVRGCAPDAQVLIRPHPGERLLCALDPAAFAARIRAYEAWLHAEYAVDARVVFDRKLEAIRAADVALTLGSSSVVPEVMLLERPVIRVRGWDGDDLYGEADGVVVVDPDGIEPALARVLAEPEYRGSLLARQAAALPELNFGHDGRAQERLAAVCLRALEARTPRAAVRGPSACVRVLLRCDASSELGLGHLVRCEALAEELREAHGCEVRFAVRGSDAAIARVARRGHDVVPLPRDVEGAAAALVEAARASESEAVLFDVRDPVPASSLAALRKSDVVLALVDDESEMRLSMDLVFLPPMPQVERLAWTGFTGTRHVGWEWVPLRRAFSSTRDLAPADDDSLLVCFGGADPAGLALRAVRALDRLDDAGPITIVAGDLFERAEELRELCAGSRHRVALEQGVADMAGLMRHAGLALASFGVTAYELAALGVPALHVSLTLDHAECAGRFEQLGIARHLGLAADVSEAALAEGIHRLRAEREARDAMSARGRALIDGRGTQRIAAALVERVGKRDG